MHSTRILGALAGVALASILPATAVATETAPFEIAGPINSCLRQANAELAGTGVQLHRADFDMVFLGADGPDEFDGYVTPGRDLFCGFGGDDTLGFAGGAILQSGDAFVGGAGHDSVDDVEAGIFIGGPGNDRANLLTTGALFVGGSDDDMVFNASSSKVFGGDGNDSVDRLYGRSRFVGGAGNDRVLTELNHGSRFLGGPGADRVLHELTDGLFRGGGGRDYVETIAPRGRFAGGDERDRVGRVQGVFLGGPGNDRVFLVEGDVYGGDGNDRICELRGGLFEGGPGLDTVGAATGGRANTIERILPCT